MDINKGLDEDYQEDGENNNLAPSEIVYLKFYTIQNILIKKYSIPNFIYDYMKVNLIMYNKHCRMNLYFQELSYTGSDLQLVKKMYSQKDCSSRLPKLFEYYKNYSKFFVLPLLLDLKANKMMQKNSDQKADIFYINNKSNHEKEAEEEGNEEEGEDRSKAVNEEKLRNNTALEMKKRVKAGMNRTFNRFLESKIVDFINNERSFTRVSHSRTENNGEKTLNKKALSKGSDSNNDIDESLFDSKITIGEMMSLRKSSRANTVFSISHLEQIINRDREELFKTPLSGRKNVHQRKSQIDHTKEGKDHLLTEITNNRVGAEFKMRQERESNKRINEEGSEAALNSNYLKELEFGSLAFTSDKQKNMDTDSKITDTKRKKNNTNKKHINSSNRKQECCLEGNPEKKLIYNTQEVSLIYNKGEQHLSQSNSIKNYFQSSLEIVGNLNKEYQFKVFKPSTTINKETNKMAYELGINNYIEEKNIVDNCVYYHTENGENRLKNDSKAIHNKAKLIKNLQIQTEDNQINSLDAQKSLLKNPLIINNYNINFNTVENNFYEKEDGRSIGKKAVDSNDLQSNLIGLFSSKSPIKLTNTKPIKSAKEGSKQAQNTEDYEEKAIKWNSKASNVIPRVQQPKNINNQILTTLKSIETILQSSVEKKKPINSNLIVDSKPNSTINKKFYKKGSLPINSSSKDLIQEKNNSNDIGGKVLCNTNNSKSSAKSFTLKDCSSKAVNKSKLKGNSVLNNLLQMNINKQKASKDIVNDMSNPKGCNMLETISTTNGSRLVSGKSVVQSSSNNDSSKFLKLQSQGTKNTSINKSAKASVVRNSKKEAYSGGKLEATKSKFQKNNDCLKDFDLLELQSSNMNTINTEYSNKSTGKTSNTLVSISKIKEFQVRNSRNYKSGSFKKHLTENFAYSSYDKNHITPKTSSNLKQAVMTNKFKNQQKAETKIIDSVAKQGKTIFLYSTENINIQNQKASDQAKHKQVETLDQKTYFQSISSHFISNSKKASSTNKINEFPLPINPQIKNPLLVSHKSNSRNERSSKENYQELKKEFSKENNYTHYLQNLKTNK
eukprot:CAMPEP_0170538592 /NCGR_PEP_ID=MMETSP0209-20121228/103413_1 /TAXON_ID=665100 ORGANISM="Litonotus pictus, Strain P1" /NCGR_SAMPLE_ID=MMETSP0209 /ASSEMBLY_ACC=CAM_ASM_000301 /LENGTH=1066 /DNA_ID=CAMNT_0010840331 /DNA_START=105 /DNA_END=3304 /DNA_ORIENTATION=+